jgi:hypothetical protein
MVVLRSAVVLLAFILAVSFTVPAQDVPETAYEESESLPFENSADVSIVVSEDCTQPITTRHDVVSVGRGLCKCNGQRHRMAGEPHSISTSRIILDCSLRC